MYIIEALTVGSPRICRQSEDTRAPGCAEDEFARAGDVGAGEVQVRTGALSSSTHAPNTLCRAHLGCKTLKFRWVRLNGDRHRGRFG